MYLTQGYTAERPAEVMFYPEAKNDDMAVQVFLGNSSSALYMSADEARDLATKIIASVPTPAPVSEA